MMNGLDCYFHTVTQRYIVQRPSDNDEERGEMILVTI